jgi:uncharacterized protein (DUF885 family)
MKKLIFMSLVFAFSACYNSKDKTKNATNIVEKALSPAVTSLFDDYYKERMKLFPFEATANGVNDYNDQFPIDISESYRETLRQFYQKYKADLGKIDASTLNDNDKMSVDILNWDLDRALDGLKLPNNLMPFNQFEGTHLSLGQLGSGEGSQPFKTTKDYDNWLKRISNLPVWADTAIANMRLGIQKGWVLPKSLTVKILPQLKPIAEDAVEKNLFYGPVSKLAANKDISTADKTRLTAEYAKMVAEVVKPSYKKLYDFINTEYLSKTRISSGISGVPEGDAYYRNLVKYWTTTDMSPDEIFALGEKEVARIRSEMEKVKEQVGFKGDLKAFFKHVNEGEPKLRPFKDPKEVLANFHAIHDKMKPQLAKQFDTEPKTQFEIRRTEAFREASASAEYMPGNLKEGRAGIFYTPIPDIKKYNLYQDESLFLHEAIPGHHYQCSLQQENSGLPEFRKNLWYGAYGEGWALYTEGLGKEMGLYTDPYQYFGRLGGEMHRAIRLVVDVGLHTKGWTREQAIKYDFDNEADTEEAITAEIERYMAIPGQALSYKVGEQRILALKNKAIQTLGNKFDIKAFHNEVLKDGCVPLALLDKKVANFVEKHAKLTPQ